MRRRMIIALALGALFAGEAHAQQVPAPGDAQSGQPAAIPFVRLGNIQDFEPDSNKGVWLQDRSRKWYYASINGPCLGLPQATRIGVDTRFGGNRLDSTGVLLVDGDRCHIGELTESGPPPGRGKKAKRD